MMTAPRNKLHKFVSANPPGPPPEATPAAEPTALAAIFRRLNESALSAALPFPDRELPAMIGFGEPAELPSATAGRTTPSVEPFVPAAEDLSALAPAVPVPPLALSKPEPPAASARIATPPATVPRGDETPDEGLPLSGRSARERPLSAAAGAVPTPDGVDSEQGLRNRRRYRRVALPAEIEVDGVRCNLIDVSVGGFAATGVPATSVNALVPVALRLTIDGIQVGTQLVARIVYTNPLRSSGRFVDASAGQTAFLRYLVTWRGESVGTAGAVTLLDAIGAGKERASADPLPDRVDDPPKDRWWAGLIGRKIASPR